MSVVRCIGNGHVILTCKPTFRLQDSIPLKVHIFDSGNNSFCARYYQEFISQGMFGYKFSVIRQFYSNVGLADTMTPVMSTSSIEWRDEDSSGTLAAGWSKDDDSKMLASRTPTGPLNQWGAISGSSWGNKLQVSSIYHTII